ncbi:acyltransferase family protein [Myceligenerans xiligouense]|uniref:Peptidoglycan/LPS O-acetylase OafA/YrhL n=1 Tax=Myceligenerans xiligouense TaxID=253184 RepID=A0A3N4ZGY6_9MICO|nr:acyltransferase family protein [Myceligenerans xiligouense]RPF20115.1 peptidoglycan/LPS O-acetylase OafA/YrhL [Myceligenerans xiligouense]
MTSAPTLREHAFAPGASSAGSDGPANHDARPQLRPGQTEENGSREGGASRTGGGFRPELHGLRAVAVLLVVAYHVWFGRVSGGVDVFLFLTGFLITGSLARAAERTGRIRPFAFLSRLASRLLPPVVIVLTGTVIATYFLMPRGRLLDTINEAIAALLYHENWYLARRAVDYNTRDEGSSLLQHFWSLSIQGQFYLVWLVVAAVALAVVWKSLSRIRAAFLVVIVPIAVLSLAYSVYLTATNQVWAYFDTGARLWEFAAGGILALTIHRIALPKALRFLLGWVGLLALIACGALFDVSTMFPGWIALWPVLSAALILVAGRTAVPGAVDGFLTWRPLSVVADWSYALYLWHWPVLLLYLNVTGTSRADARGGAYVVGISLALAALTTFLLSHRPLRLPRSVARPVRQFGYAAVWIVPVLVVGLYAQQQVALAVQREAEREAFLASDEGRYPGAGVMIDPELHRDMPDLPWIPSVAGEYDLPAPSDGRCLPTIAGNMLSYCASGDPTATRTVALVGSSRIAHYHDAFEAAAEANGWRLLTLSMNGCQYAAGTTAQTRASEECRVWNLRAHEFLLTDPPDLVVTLGSRRFEDRETYPVGYVSRWRELSASGSRILALEDIPRPAQDMLECVESWGVDVCTERVRESDGGMSLPARYEALPHGVTFRGFGPYVCPDGVCAPVRGNVLVYRDSSHLSATYAATLAPVAERFVHEATGW